MQEPVCAPIASDALSRFLAMQGPRDDRFRRVQGSKKSLSDLRANRHGRPMFRRAFNVRAEPQFGSFGAV
jgi:hypothetical protein